MKPALLAVLLLPAVYADNTNLTYTAIGGGGLSQAQAPVSANPFWWSDDTGGVAASVLDSYGYPPLNLFTGTSTPVPWSNMDYTGSLLVSSQFDLSDNQTLSVDALHFTGDSSTLTGSPYPFGFGALLENGQVRANLFFGQSNLHDLGPQLNLPPLTPGVVVTNKVSGNGFPTVPVTLGGLAYGAHTGMGSCGFCSYGQTSSFTPGAGTYQLLFGAFAAGSGRGWESQLGGEDAMAVTSVNVSSVPELVSWPILLALLGCAFAIRRYRFSLIHSTEV